ncbi:AarF/UbiB family protein [Rubripirellula sp.]|nr:AarF/UbiB family protein [Rubripirellula sp.]MDB4749750.1 AarF/UbiB family protein [Rubripirellula sp.]
MKITAIPQLYRNLRRWREILAVLRRYGLADWLTHFRLPFRDTLKDRGGVPLSQYSREQRVRMALTDLGPTFIKLGQILASRPDLVGPSLSEELKQLRANVEPDEIEQVRETLRNELGKNYESHFQTIDFKPLATASIGQVHRAVLNDGSRVVLKVQRTGIERKMQQDIEVLAGIAQLAERVDALSVWGPVEMVRQLAPMITRELDFTRERQNLDQFAEMFSRKNCDVVIPRPVNALCTRRVLVMDELIGEPLSIYLAHHPDLAPDDHAQATDPAHQQSGDETPKAATNQQLGPKSTKPVSFPDDKNRTPFHTSEGHPDRIKQRLGETIAEAYLTMLFDEALFHADPHSGNLIVMDGGTLGILDFGMIGRIDETLRETIEEMLVAISSGDQHRLVRLIRRVGDAPPTLDDSALAIDVTEFIGTYGRQRLGEFDLTGALNELSEILHRHAIKLPNQSALLLKMLVSLEGTLGELGARFDGLEAVRSFMARSVARRLSPQRRVRQARRIYLEAENFLEAAPDELISLIRQARKGEVRVILEHQRLSPTVNRMVLGLMTSAVFLGSSLLLAMKVPPVLFHDESWLALQDISLLGLLGFFGSMTVMLWLLLAINRSGHLTRHNED